MRPKLSFPKIKYQKIICAFVKVCNKNFIVWITYTMKEKRGFHLFNSLLDPQISAITNCNAPRKHGSWGQHGAHLGPVGLRWAPCWPHESCYHRRYPIARQSTVCSIACTQSPHINGVPCSKQGICNMEMHGSRAWDFINVGVSSCRMWIVIYAAFNVVDDFIISTATASPNC